jgi:hypothetical protein
LVFLFRADCRCALDRAGMCFVSGATTMPRSVFALRTSVFDNFLYASIGEEKNGMVLTALSALARAGVDPWDEAARLSALPREAAAKRLTSIISGLSPGQWTPSVAKGIAERLASLLPDKQAPVAQGQVAVRTKPPISTVTVIFLVIFFVNALAFTVLRNHQSQPVPDQGATTSSSTVDPAAPTR